MKNKNKYWLVIYPYVFIFIKGDIVLFYNSKTASFTYCNASEITNELNNKENLYSIPICLKQLRDEKSHSLIYNLIHRECGELIPFDNNGTKPLSIFPQLIIDDIHSDKSGDKNYKRFSELKELTLFINGNCSSNCKNCSISFKQHLWCHKQSGEISFEKIRNFLSFLPLSGVVKINITGGDIFNYSELKHLIIFLNQFSIIKNYLIHSTLILDNANKLEWFVGGGDKFDILFEPMCEKGLIKKVVEILSKNQISSRYIMVVTSDEDYEYAVYITDEYKIDFEIVPLYTDKNLVFFEKNVFLNIDDILNNHVSMKEIFSHQFVNTNNFGRFVLSHDEKIYANVNDNFLGTIDDDVYRLVDLQLKKGSIWRNIRNNFVCSDCIYQWLCPSPSDYNFVLNRFNLCNIRIGNYTNAGIKIESNQDQLINTK